ncbi:bacterioferritin [Haloglycomyces albus]|uniref:bacterioferritin n=1 Tax=Haloglycomyces albus TaxID=526067 RepID=UPI00046CBC21|nr:bacterioferritin [Haloglycomyces albus]
MYGDERVIEFLNEQLTAELTAINQYFLHSKMQAHHGWTKLAKASRDESMEEMNHAEMLADRILWLDGLPNFQRLFPLRIGQSVTEMYQSDRELEVEAIDRLRRGVEYMESARDYTSREIFVTILKDEEEHIEHIDTQLELIEKLGEDMYIQTLLTSPDEPQTGV